MTSTLNNVITESSIPHFLLKLWKLVDDPKFRTFIAWDNGGLSFRIIDPFGFSRDVLPLYFKHSNLNSFIRQLNMYGFRKVNSLEKGSLKPPPGELEAMEFQHPYFVMDHPELLDLIRRKTASNNRPGNSNPPGPSSKILSIAPDFKSRQNAVLGGHSYAVDEPFDDLAERPYTTATAAPSSEDSSVLRAKLDQVLLEMRKIKQKQFDVDRQFSRVQLENDTLWREIAVMRRTHLKQQEVVDKLVKFLLMFTRRPPDGQQGSQVGKGLQLAKRQLLAIGSANDSRNPKRRRSNDLAFRPVEPLHHRRELTAGQNADDAADIIAVLQRELWSTSSAATSLHHRTPTYSPASASPPPGDDCVTIDDVTHEFPVTSLNSAAINQRNVGTVEVKKATRGRKYKNVKPPQSPNFPSEDYATAAPSFDKAPRQHLTKWELTSPRVVTPPSHSPAHGTMTSQQAPPMDELSRGVDGVMTSALAHLTNPAVVDVNSPLPSPPAHSSTAGGSVDQGSFCVESSGRVTDPSNFYDFQQTTTPDEISMPSTDVVLAENYSVPSPIFSDQLNFVQGELDGIRELISSDFNLSPNDLNELFSMSENSPLYRMDTSGKYQVLSDGNDIMGNEVQLYRPPSTVFKLTDDGSLANSMESHGNSAGRATAAKSMNLLCDEFDPTGLNTPIFSPDSHQPQWNFTNEDFSVHNAKDTAGFGTDPKLNLNYPVGNTRPNPNYQTLDVKNVDSTATFKPIGGTEAVKTFLPEKIRANSTAKPEISSSDLNYANFKPAVPDSTTSSVKRADSSKYFVAANPILNENSNEVGSQKKISVFALNSNQPGANGRKIFIVKSKPKS